MVVYVRRQGEESSQDEKGVSAILAAQLDSELGGSPVQVTFALCIDYSIHLLDVYWNIDQGCPAFIGQMSCRV